MYEEERDEWEVGLDLERHAQAQGLTLIKW